MERKEVPLFDKDAFRFYAWMRKGVTWGFWREGRNIDNKYSNDKQFFCTHSAWLIKYSGSAYVKEENQKNWKIKIYLYNDPNFTKKFPTGLYGILYNTMLHHDVLRKLKIRWVYLNEQGQVIKWISDTDIKKDLIKYNFN